MNGDREPGFLRRNPKKSALALLLLGLGVETIRNDHVHFGSTTLNNPQGNHYVWGIVNNVDVVGEEANGNIHNFGLIWAGNSLEPGSHLNGNLNSYGFASMNNLKDNSKMYGNGSSYGLLVGANDLESYSEPLGDWLSIGLISGTGSDGRYLASNKKINFDSVGLFIIDDNFGMVYSSGRNR